MTISFAWLILSTASISRCLTTDHFGKHHSELRAGGTLPRDERWNAGRAALFSVKEYSATDLVRMIQKKTDLAVTPVSKRYVEAYLPDE